MGQPAALRIVDLCTILSLSNYDHFVHKSMHLCQTWPLAASAGGWAAGPGPESYKYREKDQEKQVVPAYDTTLQYSTLKVYSF